MRININGDCIEKNPIKINSNESPFLIRLTEEEYGIRDVAEGGGHFVR